LRSAPSRAGRIFPVYSSIQTPRGDPQLNLLDGASKAGFLLRFFGSGNPGIKMVDPKGVVRGQFSLAQESEPLFELYDAAGKARVTIGSATVRNEKTGAPEARPISSLPAPRRDGKGDFRRAEEVKKVQKDGDDTRDERVRWVSPRAIHNS